MKFCNNWAKHPKKFAVSDDEHGALSLLQKALQKRITLFLSSGTGLTSEGAHFQRILQLCLAREFREGNDSLIRHIVFPPPLIHYIERPFSSFRKTPEIIKYKLECANAARLLTLNSNSTDKNLGTFLSATELVGLDEDFHCEDPIRQVPITL